MIDTIKLSLDRTLNTSIYDSLLLNSEQRMHGFLMNSSTGIHESTELWRAKSQQYNVYNKNINNYETHEMLIINGKMRVPSWNYNIHYRAFEDRIELEFSLPKFIYGTNVLELRSHYNKLKGSPYDFLLMGVKKFFNYFFFGHKVDYGGIKLLRWDFCYNQVFGSLEDSLKTLHFIKYKHEKKKDTKSFETGFVQLSKTNYLKIYHKGAEFNIHDKQQMIKSKNNCYIDQLEILANKTLRYEKKCTPKNMAYFYNVNYKHQFQQSLIKDYYKAKKEGKVTKEQRRDFELVQQFTLGNSKLLGCTRMEEFVFNHIYTRFREEILKKFNVANASIDRLKHEVINEDDKQNKTMKIRIFALIKTFQSIERAYEKKAISKSTKNRYLSFMNEKNLSTTNIKNTIYQDWKSQNYYNEIFKLGINVNF